MSTPTSKPLEGLSAAPGRPKQANAPSGSSAVRKAKSVGELPLAGLRVVEFTHMVMGPTCGMVLADMGAEVIKVEPLTGDGTRRLQPQGLSARPLRAPHSPGRSRTDDGRLGLHDRPSR